MCGIIGFAGPNTADNRARLTRLLEESAIRGLHSMGMAWIERDQLQVQASGIVPQMMEDMFVRCENIFCIAHTRYSTSNIEWPLPILGLHPDTKEGMAVVLNGVISQEEPDKWPSPYEDLPYQTGNDAEIAAQYFFARQAGQHGGSFAVGMLSRNAMFYRNGERPLYACYGGSHYSVVASTKDILVRSWLTAEMIPPGVMYNLSTGKHSVIPGLFGTPELQPHFRSTTVPRCEL